MLWIQSLHIIAIVAWFAGLFYLPRLFVYHADSMDDTRGKERFKIMERRLYYGIMLPAAFATVFFGILLFCAAPTYYLHAHWFHVKLLLLILLIGFHIYCGALCTAFKQDKNKHSSLFYRILNEIPTLFLASIVILTVVKPF